MIREGIHINAVYQHYKGGYYRVLEVANHHNELNLIVIYHKCDKNGIFKSIRSEINGEVEIIVQPFFRDLDEFLEEVNYAPHQYKQRFKFIKDL